MKVNLSELEEKYGPFDPYGGTEMFFNFVNKCIPDEYRKVGDLEFKVKVFKESFIECKRGYRELKTEEVLNSKFIKGYDKDKISIIRDGDCVSVFWRFVRPEDILKKKIEEIKDLPTKFYSWVSFLFTKYNVLEGKYSLDEVVEYYSNKDEVDPTTVEGILKMMDKNLCKRYFSIRECIEKNLDRISPRKILDRFDEDDLEEIFYENLGDRYDFIYGDNGTVLTFKK
jgi:hypothetical protein